jgi:regulation of enolase protein 1 (concanavalin A-like superfamily)
MTIPDHVTIPALPVPLYWLAQPQSSESDEATLSITCGPRCDLFVDPGGAISTGVEKPPMLVFEPSGDFALSARVGVDFAATYDAGVLVLFRDDSCWAKLCFERSPQGQPMVVSVVNQRVSDDCNHFPVTGTHIWFRVARGGNCVAFHTSTDGTQWQLVRYFGFPSATGMSVGFEAQSPTGEGCRVTFDEIHYEAGGLADLRSGG